MPAIDLHYVDELIAARQAQHGGGRGAPPKLGEHREGTSINRSCIVMLSALLQAHIDDVFKEAAKRTFPALNNDEEAFKAYWKQMGGRGNPSAENIKRLFLLIGIPDVFAGLSWQRTTTEAIQRKLDDLNQIRNQIAHGSRDIKVRNKPYSLTLVRVAAFRDLAFQLGAKFPAHVEEKTPAR